MALQSSGAISIANINAELQRSSTTTASLNDTALRSLAGVASGAISLSNFYGKRYWIYNSGSYAYNSFVTSRWDTTKTFYFTGVRPKSMWFYIRLWQADWSAWVGFSIDLYYESSGWVNVFSASHDNAEWETWEYSITVGVDYRAELATAYRFTQNARNNGDTQEIKFTEWYT